MLTDSKLNYLNLPHPIPIFTKLEMKKVKEGITKLSSGQFFGEEILVANSSGDNNNIKYNATVKASCVTSCWKLHRSDYEQLRKQFS